MIHVVFQFALHVLLALVLFGSAGATMSYAAEPTHRTLSVAGIAREFLLSRPSQTDPRPAVLVLHGGLMSAKQARQSIGIESMVDREKIVAVYPAGIGRQWNDGRRWRSGGLERQASTADDVSFLRALIAALVVERVVDPQRVYTIGPSNGGMMSFRLVCEAADLVAAAAAIGANMPADLVGTCKPARPVSVLIMNGTADPWVPYHGGGISPGGKGEVLSTNETVGLFRRFNGCVGDAIVERLPSRTPGGPSTVTHEVWSRCAASAAVVLYRIEGGGHRIPVRDAEYRPVINLLLGPQNTDFDGIRAIWDFLRDKRR